MDSNEIFKMYEEATSLFKKGDFEEALYKYERIILEGGKMWDDDVMLRVVNAALKQKRKCQFRVLKF